MDVPCIPTTFSKNFVFSRFLTDKLGEALPRSENLHYKIALLQLEASPQVLFCALHIKQDSKMTKVLLRSSGDA